MFDSLVLHIVARFGITEPMPNKKKKNPHAVALGRLGGLKGGKARTAKLSAEERRALARKAVLARWAKAKEKGKKQKE
jgi:hypothetical protein